MNLPELPEARIVSNQYDSTMRVTTLHTYDAADMRAYAEEAVRMERERATIWCPGCGDGITAHDPGVCGNCLAMKYEERRSRTAVPAKEPK